MSYVDAIRQTTAWLRDGTLGVNALLASVPKESGDAVPPDVRIFDSTEQNWVARALIERAKLEDGPVLLISAFPTAEVSLYNNQIPNESPLPVAVRYAARKTDTAILQVQAWQTIRAAARSLVKQATQNNAIRRNAVMVGPLVGLTHITALEEKEDDLLIDILTVTLNVTDAWALGGTPS